MVVRVGLSPFERPFQLKCVTYIHSKGINGFVNLLIKQANSALSSCSLGFQIPFVVLLALMTTLLNSLTQLVLHECHLPQEFTSSIVIAVYIQLMWRRRRPVRSSALLLLNYRLNTRVHL